MIGPTQPHAIQHLFKTKKESKFATCNVGHKTTRAPTSIVLFDLTLLTKKHMQYKQCLPQKEDIVFAYMCQEADLKVGVTQFYSYTKANINRGGTMASLKKFVKDLRMSALSSKMSDLKTQEEEVTAEAETEAAPMAGAKA